MKKTFEKKIKKQLEQELDSENLIVSEALIKKTLEKIKTAEQQKKEQEEVQQKTQQQIQQEKENLTNNFKEKKETICTKKHKRNFIFSRYKFLLPTAAIITIFLFSIKTLVLNEKFANNNNYEEMSGIKEIQNNESCSEESIKENTTKYGTSEEFIKNKTEFSEELKKNIEDIISFTVSTGKNTIEILKDSKEEKEIKKIINSIIKVNKKEERDFLESTNDFGEKIGEIIEKRKNDFTITYKFYDTAYIIIEEIKSDNTKIESIGKIENIEQIKKILEQI